jgi:hypothetical protein
MIPHVTIIALLFSFTAAHAAPRFEPPQKRSKCERSLVSDVVEQRVQDMAVEIAELMGAIKQKSAETTPTLTAEQLERFSKNLYVMYGRASEIRENFTVSAGMVEGLIEGLKEQMSSQLPEIRAALNPAAKKSAAPASPQPRNHMKREVFDFDPAIRDWPANEVSAYLRQPHAPIEAPQQQQAKPQVLGQRPVVHGPEGYRPYGTGDKP